MSAFCQAGFVNIEYFDCVGTFVEVNGSSRILKPGQKVRLAPTDNNGRVPGEVVFSVEETDLFHTFGTVTRTGPEFGVVLGKGGVLPWKRKDGDLGRPYNNVFTVWGQGVTITHEPTGKEIKVVYVKD